MSSENMESSQGENKIIENMQRFLEICFELEPLLDQTWKDLILGNTREAMLKLADAFAYLDKIFYQAEVLNSYQVININPAEILQKVSALESAMAIPDYIFTADLIKYEIKPIIIAWRKSVYMVIKKMKVKMN